jgi:hypothetical protein
MNPKSALLRDRQAQILVHKLYVKIGRVRLEALDVRRWNNEINDTVGFWCTSP